MKNKKLFIEIIELKKKVKDLTEMVIKLSQDKSNNKDGIPINIDIFADIESIGKVVLTTKRRSYKVKEINNQEIAEGKEFNSLSAAAEAFSKIKRKSGWIFWRNTETGRTLKEMYKG